MTLNEHENTVEMVHFGEWLLIHLFFKERQRDNAEPRLRTNDDQLNTLEMSQKIVIIGGRSIASLD